MTDVAGNRISSTEEILIAKIDHLYRYKSRCEKYSDSVRVFENNLRNLVERSYDMFDKKIEQYEKEIADIQSRTYDENNDSENNREADRNRILVLRNEIDTVRSVRRSIEDLCSQVMSKTSAVRGELSSSMDVADEGSQYLSKKLNILESVGDVSFGVWDLGQPKVDGDLQPNSLSSSVEGWKALDDGTFLYDSPVETSKFLNCNQGAGEGVPNFEGTCVLTTVSNIGRMAGLDIDEKTMVEFATKYDLCTTGGTPDENGGVFVSDIPRIFAGINLDAREIDPDMDTLADEVAGGHGVLAVVDVSRFWGRNESGQHAITILSVKRDAMNNVQGFYVCDSGTHGRDGCRYVPVDLMRRSTLHLFSTNNIIR